MKKLVLLAIVATFATSAFAQKGLVELQGCFDGSCDTLDFDMYTDTDEAGDDANASDDMTIALNYNHLFTDNFGAGIVYISEKTTNDGDITSNDDNHTTTGINLFWNFDGGWMGSYVALRYWMKAEEDQDNNGAKGDDITTTVLEYGKRIALGKAMGVSFAWNPSVQYVMTTTAPGASGADDESSTNLTIVPVNFAVAF